MSAEIKSTAGLSTLTLVSEGVPKGSAVGVTMTSTLGHHRWAGGDWDRADFLAAVTSELNVRIVPADAIVVERGELPPVTAAPNGDSGYKVQLHIMADSPLVDAAYARKVMLRWLALAEYLDAHPPKPPVDEAEVIRVRDHLRSVVADGAISWSVIARRLVEAGVRAPEATA